MINAPPNREGLLRAQYQPRQSKLLLRPRAVAWWRDLSVDRVATSTETVRTRMKLPGTRKGMQKGVSNGSVIDQENARFPRVSSAVLSAGPIASLFMVGNHGR